MSFNSEYQELRKKRKKNEQENKASNDIAPLKFSMSDIAPVYEYNAKKEDIAPVAKTEKTEGDGWFQKGAFADGRQKGDLYKTTVGTAVDAETNFGAGLLGIGEKILDGLATLGAAMNNQSMMEAASNEMIYNRLAGNKEEADTTLKRYMGYQEEVEKDTAEFVSKDLYNEEDIAKKIIQMPQEKLFGVNAETDSVLAAKSDSLIQSAGQLTGTMALQAAGVPWYLTTGATAFGSEAESAFNSGATFDEAVLSATVSAGAEILTEKLSGGIKFGGKALDDVLTEALAKNISSKAARTLMKLGIDAVGEGNEEILSGVMSAIGQKLSYADDKELKELFTKEDAWDSFIGGAALGAGSNVINNVKTQVVDGVDALTGLTKNEEKVVNKEVENRIAEKEANGEKVTAKVKNEIYNEVMEDLTKGYISTDTIESVLDGKSYESYKNLRDNESRLNEKVESLTKEIDTLLDKENPTIRDNERLAEARKELETAKSDLEKIGGYINEHITYTRHNMSEALKGERKGKGSYLAESYNEIDRLSQRYVADFSKYEGTKHADAARKTIENAMRRGANNTNRVHDIVEMGAKLSSDTGIVFDWAGNEDIKKDFIEQQKKEIAKLEAMTELSEEQSGTLAELKEMLRKVEAGEITVNGNITDNGVVINLDSKKALNRIVGHEIAHSLEKSAAYTELKEALFAYAKDKGFDVDAEIEAKTKTYKGVKKAQPEAELVADLVGDYIFNDYDFVLNLATNNRNVFQKVYDEVKYLYKLATAGSKEARDLARAKRNFERAYQESANPSTKDSGKSAYSLSEAKTPTRKELESKKPIKVINVKEGLESGSYADMKTAAMNKATSEGWFDVPHHNIDTDSLIFLTEKSFTHAYSNLRSDFGEDTIRCMAHIPEIIQEAVLVSVDDPKNPRKAETKVYTFFGAIDGVNGLEPVKLTVKEFDFRTLEAVPQNIRAYFEKNGISEKYNSLYDAHALEVIGIEGIQKESDASGKVGEQGSRAQATSDSKISIADLLNLVKGDAEKYIPQYSLSDSDGKQLSKGQQEYFKNSKMRDENGNLKVMYHGSQDAGFHVFDAKMSDDDTSLFFVDRNDVAASYSGTSETYEAQTIRTAEDVNKFIESIGAEGYEVIEEGGTFTLEHEGDYVASSDTAKGIYEEFCWYEGVGHGDANYKVYLNLTNPLVVDAEGRNWNKISREFSQEVYDKYQSLTAEEKEALTQLASWGEISIFRDEINDAFSSVENGKIGALDDPYIKNLAAAHYKLDGANVYDMFTIASENFSEESLREFAVKQMNTRDYAKRAKEQGYDGVIFNNIHDNGGYSNGSEGASTVAIAFSSEQIKSVANTEPTDDPDIRFSLSEAVEETKDLIAVHNLKSNELLKSFELGGLPMPSIAVVKADAAHDQYGEISLILPKESIDPQASRDNKVYGGDAWTPTYPKIEYKANEAVAQKISDKYYELYRKYGSDEVRPLYNYTYNMDDTLTRHGGEASMLEDLYDSTGIMQVYLLDTGKGKVETVRKEKRTELSDAEVEMNEFFINELGADVVDGVMNLGILSPSEHRIKYWGEHGEKIKEAYHKFLSEEYGFSQEEIENVLAGMKTYDYMKIVRDAHLYRKNGRVTTKTEADHKATEEAIREAAGEGYKDWINGLFKGIEEKTGIRNNRDYFTPSGNRRSWEALHWENTLENVVRVMRQQNQTGADAMFGAHQLFAVAAKEYGSIDDIKADSDRLYKMSEEEYEAVKESYSKRMLDIAHRIMDKGERNQFIAVDNAMECIVDAVRNSRTQEGIYKELSQYRQLNVTEQDVADIVSLVNDISNMPTGYFEAKPMRAVGFDEVGVFVIPRNADVKLKQELLNRGYAIAEYDPDVEGDRQKVVNSFEKYKFSLSDAGEQLAPLGRREMLGSDFRVRGDNVLAPVQEAVAKNATTTQGTVSKMEQVAPRADLPISDVDYAPVVDERARLEARAASLQEEMDSLRAEAKELGNQLRSDDITSEDYEARVFGEIRPRYSELAEERKGIAERLKSLEETEAAEQGERLDSLNDSDAPSEIAPYYGEQNGESTTPSNPFEQRDYTKVGNPKTQAYTEENPEAKPFFREAAQGMLGDLQHTLKGERWYNDALYSESGGEQGFSGTRRDTTADIADLLDGQYHYTYQQIEDALNAIINDEKLNACAKRIEFALNDRLLNGYTDIYGNQIPPNQDYINMIGRMRMAEDIHREGVESIEHIIEAPLPPVEAEAVAQPTIEAPLPEAEAYEATRPKQSNEQREPRMKRVSTESNAKQGEKERKWVNTSTSSEAVDGIITPDDIPDDARYYQVKSNKKTLETANARLARDGYAKSREYFEGRMSERKLTVEDIALGERLIQEAAKAGDAKAVRDLIIDVSILGTELGQRVQALSMIRRLTPEGQLKTLQRTIERGKTKGDKAFEGVEVTDEMTKRILSVYNEDGTFDQDKLNKAVEDAKQDVADQMSVSAMDYINSWRYLSMLGNPKTHIRNMVSNVAMLGTRTVKNAIARTIEDIAPVKSRTKTWKSASEAVKNFAKQTTKLMEADISDDAKYSEEGSIKAKRKVFKTKAVNAASNFNSAFLEWEDAVFSKPAFRHAFQEFLTANGIVTEEDIKGNPKIVEKAKDYALDEAKKATFRQDSYFANKIKEVENKNPAFGVTIGAVMPFKKTPINIAKTGVAYSPLGFARNVYDAVKVAKGEMEASEAIDHLAQTLTGTSLTLIGYFLASAGVLNGAGEDDKEGKYDYQLGEQSYSFNFGGDTYSLNWLSPVAMPLFVGANAYEKLVEKEEWDMNIVSDTLAQTLDPLSEMSFLSSLDDVLSSYDSGVGRIKGAAESLAQSYITQFIPTLSSQVASVMDDTKRSTKASGNSGFEFGEETLKKIMYKIPGLRNKLEPTTDIWGNDYEQTESVPVRAFESFFSPASKREDITTFVDEELKTLYGETGATEVLPSIPDDYFSYEGEKYDMSAKEYTEFKKTYGQTAYELLSDLFMTDTYESSSYDDRAKMVKKVFDYARDEAKQGFFATREEVEYSKDKSIKGAILNDMSLDEYSFYEKHPEKYAVAKSVGGYDSYTSYTKALYDIEADKDESGKSIRGSRKEKVIAWVNEQEDLDYGEAIILFKSEYPADDTYNYDIIDYLNGRDDISYQEMETILKELGFNVDSEGNITWD